MTISPQGAIDAGAKWLVDGGTPQTSGTKVDNLAVGTHTVSFSDVLGWTKPIPQTVTINNGQTTTASGTYSVVTVGDQWAKTYGVTGYEYAYSIQQTADGGYIVAGYTSSSGAGDTDAWVLKLNSDGTVAWQKTYGGTGDIAYSIQQTADGGYIVAGCTNSFGAGNRDAWVLKLNTTAQLPGRRPTVVQVMTMHSLSSRRQMAAIL